MTAWLGVDPGPRYTGIAAVPAPGTVQRWKVLDRDDDPATYFDRVEAEVQAALLDLDAWAGNCAIENATTPGGFRDGRQQFVRPGDLLELGRIVGYLQRAFPAALLVPPHKHGSRPWRSYPPVLVTKAEARHAALRPNGTAGQSSVMRHARSAYDVACAAPQARRLTLAHERRTKTTPRSA